MIRSLFALLLCACRIPVAQLPIGTRVPIDELYQRRTDVAGFVQAELDAGHGARAFYALELLKTREYSIEGLAARDKSSPALAVADLRPVFLATLGPTDAPVVASRGLFLQADAAAKVGDTERAGDAAFWAHLRRFEKRTVSRNETTPGLPYDYAARRGYGVSTAEETALLFGDSEAFVSYFVHGEVVTAFVIVHGKLHTQRIAATTTALRERVRRLVQVVRAPPAGPSNAWVADSRALATLLLDPIEPLLGRKVTALYISPHGPLANVPFGVLVDAANRPLVVTRRVTYQPSASIYRQLLSRPLLDKPPRMLAVGNAIYPDERVPKLTSADREATTVSEVFPGSRLLAGKAASEAQITALARDYNILHFATHGVLLGNIVPGASSLLVTADDSHDGFLSAAEIARLDLSHSYIAVLSACETAVSDDRGRSIDLGSITNAFLTAGAPSVVGTLWQVNDDATTLAMLEFYRQFLEVGAGEALRRAQLAVRADPRFAHPYYWGAFALYGWDK